MAPLRAWADLHPDLFVQIADRIGCLKGYASARGACTSWRRALAPPFPALLAAAEGATMFTSRPSAAPLLSPGGGGSFELAPVASGCRCVGANGGWLALCVRVAVGPRETERPTPTAFFLANSVTGAEIALPPLLHETKWIAKAVFAPSPAADDFAVAAIRDTNTIIYATAGDTSWAVLGPVVRPGVQDHLADLVYHDQGHKVYCLTRCGLVHVLHLPERRRRKPAIVLDPTKLSVLRPPESIGVVQVHPDDLTVPVTIAPHWMYGQRGFFTARATCRPPTTNWTNNQPIRTHPLYWSSRGNEDCDEEVTEKIDDPYWTLSAEPQEPELISSPARIEPLLSATDFAPPYRAVSAIANAKHLVFCDGNMYQVWRNTSCTVSLQAPGGIGNQHRVLLEEVIVLRYYPNKRRPLSCWDVVKDLGGYSFFVGRNNAVSVYAEGVPGLRGNCVYWIDGHCREKGMVFDMATGRSTPCRPPAEVAAPAGCPRRICLWYFLSDMVTTHSSDGGRKLRNTLDIQQQQASH
ncbi:unnamed protein product [Urochloa humidicola]